MTFLSFLQGAAGARINGNARGTFVGMTLGTKKADMARAVMEGICYEMYDIIRAGIVFDFGRLFNGDLGNMSDQWDNAAIAGTPWASIAKRMQKQLDKQFKAIIDSFIALENK